MEDWTSVPCSVYRGGTSKGVFIFGKHLPQDPAARDEVILSIFGSPDPKQVNGLGGATPTTSKLAIIEPSSRPDADVDYTFGQVSVTGNEIDYRPNCGNISSAVGPFAVESGLVRVTGDEAVVRIYNTNSKTLISSKFPVRDGHFVPEGDTAIAGVPGTGSKIILTFHELGGAVTGKLLPTGRPLETVVLPDGREFHVTVIDAGNLTVVMDAAELGVMGTEVTEIEFDRRGDVFDTMESVRQLIGRNLNLYGAGEAVTAESHALPKIACVAEPQTYETSNKETVNANELDLLARVLTMGRLHPSYAVTGAIALGVTSQIEGTLTAMRAKRSNGGDFLRIGHPSGVLETAAKVELNERNEHVVKSVSLIRTARPIMDGAVWVPSNIFRQSHIV